MVDAVQMGDLRCYEPVERDFLANTCRYSMAVMVIKSVVTLRELADGTL